MSIVAETVSCTSGDADPYVLRIGAQLKSGDEGCMLEWPSNPEVAQSISENIEYLQARLQSTQTNSEQHAAIMGTLVLLDHLRERGKLDPYKEAFDLLCEHFDMWDVVNLAHPEESQFDIGMNHASLQAQAFFDFCLRTQQQVLKLAGYSFEQSPRIVAGNLASFMQRRGDFHEQQPAD